MSEPKEKAAKPIVDVAQPGKTAPPLTSKPVIVTNRAILKDPMVVEKSDKNDKNATPVTKSRTKVAVASDIDDTETTESATESAQSKPEHVLVPTASSVAADTAETPAPEKSPDQEKPVEAKSQTEPEPKGTDDTEVSSDDESSEPNDGAAMTDAQIQAEAAAETARDAQIQKLIDSKKYYVPVNAVEKRRTKRVVALGVILSLILALAWVDVALDAGLIEINGIKPVTHFFSN